MKHICFALSLILLLSSCHKDLSSKDEVITAVVASDANSALKSHKLTFTSNYAVNPGEVPPFSFTKTQYSDATIKTIRMLSRKNPIYPGFKKEAEELIGTFTYRPYTGPSSGDIKVQAFLKGTKEVWEYYKLPNGTGARRSVSKKNIDMRFDLNASAHCLMVWALDGDDSVFPNTKEYIVLDLLYLQSGDVYSPALLARERQFAAYREYTPVLDDKHNLLTFNPTHPEQNLSTFKISYDYNLPRGSRNYSFIPPQNLISQEFSLLEVMQWLPQPTHQRKTAGGIFYVNGVKVSQDQVYKNYKFDANGNQTSLTYGDNVLQKTTWHVQP